jgi:hypothetical protein
MPEAMRRAPRPLDQAPVRVSISGRGIALFVRTMADKGVMTLRMTA